MSCIPIFQRYENNYNVTNYFVIVLNLVDIECNAVPTLMPKMTNIRRKSSNDYSNFIAAHVYEL